MMEKLKEAEEGVVFESDHYIPLTLKRNITIEELITKVSLKIRVVGQRRLFSLQYRFPTELFPLTYTSFKLSNNDDVSMMVDAHMGSSQSLIEMYATFIEVRATRGLSYSSHFGIAYQTDQVNSPTQLICNDFTSLMADPTPDTMPSSSIGRHSSATAYDLNPRGFTNNPYGHASENLFDLNIGLSEEPSSPPEEPLREPDLPDVGNYGLQSLVNDGNLHIGMEFASKEEAMMAIKSYNIRNSVKSRVDRSNTEKYVCYCVQRDNGCQWMVRVSKRKRKNNLWELTRYNVLIHVVQQCINAVKYCKPVVQIDGTFLYVKYKQVLLLVVVQDENRNILPVAFALVQGEDTESWAFFLKNLRLHVVTRERVCIISDRGAGIKAAMDSLGTMYRPPYVQHRYCVRHIAANYYGKYKKNDERQLVVRMGYELLPQRFESMLQELFGKNKKGCEYIMDINKEMWTNAYDGGYRYGHMTTNLAEAINSTLKGACHLPVTALVKTTYFRLGQLFAKLGGQALTWMQNGHIYHPRLVVDLQKKVVHQMGFKLAKGAFPGMRLPHVASNSAKTQIKFARKHPKHRHQRPGRCDGRHSFIERDRHVELHSRSDQRDADPQMERALAYCAELYIPVVKYNLPQAIEALSKGRFEFASDGISDAAKQADACEKKLSGSVKLSPLSERNKLLHSLSDVASPLLLLKGLIK
ncbi:hypothetical protein F3Y22_tig00110472pilonHSYRG00505 [Hibiscus syriacus]|uniref:Transposase MuDR plant domain-containing protein n=1 Tax=Hibiscus syriacus TaxID=106335 RepID=A0A6A3AIG0_HIBSY|nr:hypothetical protein F3Y22_tig00110472pilonHSYRG00505 [Hibiscus syriacus]